MRVQIETLFSVLKDAESNARGFVITGDEVFLTSYQSAVDSVPARLQVLTDSVSDNTSQVERLGELSRRVESSLGHLKSVEKKTYPGIEEVHQQTTELLTDYGSDISLHEGLYKAFVRYKDGQEFTTLGHKEQYLVTQSIKDFELADNIQ